MRRLRYIATAGLLLAGVAAYPQDLRPGPGYQMMMLVNPAYAGAEGNGILRLSYSNLYPGRGLDLHLAYASYDSYFPLLHGGAGIYVSNDYSGGIINDTKAGLNYSYHLRAGEDIYINAGLGASLIHRGFNRGGIVFPDQIDPVLGAVYQSADQSDLKGRSVLDINTGFLIIAGNYCASLAVGHLTRPDMTGMEDPEERLRRTLSLHLSGSFAAGSGRMLELTPLAYGELQGSYFETGAGIAASLDFLEISAVGSFSSANDLDIQTGISLINDKFFVFYTYTFNIYSGNSLLPISLMHHAGIGLSLNYVEKRKTVRTINIPKL